ncbi:MAG: 30S ribosomal protein S6 [Alphaproteobacteria bacterium GM202ARS2]|nr:30S ribosomal protein S6 [Alphaproteobacteria bacterium GM202ARS2]
MLYENVFILRQDLTPGAASSLADKYAQLLEKNGGKVVEREEWGLVDLAYRIHKNKRGYFFLFHIDGPPSCVQAMESAMRLDEEALRYMTVRVKNHEPLPSVMMRYLDRNREAREEREAETTNDRAKD